MTQSQQNPYASYRQFYEANCGDAIVDAKDLGAAEATMLSLKQGAGDWSDPPVPDLVIVFLKHEPARALFDLGAGRFGARIQPGQGIVVSPDVATEIKVYDPHDLIALSVPYQRLTGLLPGWLPSDGDFGSVHAGEVSDPFIFLLLKRLWEDGDTGSRHGRLFAEGALAALAACLLRQSSIVRKAPSVRGGLAPWQVRRAVEHLKGHLAEDVGLVELATEVGLSPFHFARAFKSSLGLPPHRYQMRLRIERACELLESTNLPVTEVAFRVGYESSQALARVFSREMGTTPSAWRRQKRS